MGAPEGWGWALGRGVVHRDERMWGHRTGLVGGGPECRWEGIPAVGEGAGGISRKGRPRGTSLAGTVPLCPCADFLGEHAFASILP